MKYKLTALALALALVFLAACAGQPQPASQAASAGPASMPANASSAPQAESSWQDSVRMSMALSSYAVPPALDDKVRTWYEVFLYSYADSDGDGIGDIRGLISMLDYIQWMGFNGIWLMPVHPGASYHKYDVLDYYSIAPEYGMLADFDALIAECEARGIHIIIDLVLNHTAEDHPWFKQAAAALATGDVDDPTVGFYNFEQRDAAGVWYAVPGAPGWAYEAQFWSGMPDLNLHDEGLREEIAAITQFWLGKGVAGFRLDATGEYVSGNTSENVAILAWLNETVESQNPDAYIVGENWDSTTGLYDYYASGVDSFFDFPFAGSTGLLANALLKTGADGEAAKYGGSMAAAHDAIQVQNPQASDAPFFTNHDTARAAGFLRRDEALIKTAWGMNLMQSGNAFMYYGEEIGMSGSGKDENKRAPMLWTADPAAEGMTAGPPEMEAQNHSFAPLDEQIATHDSILLYIRQAIGLRSQYPAIARGDVEVLAAEGKQMLLRKTWQGEIILLTYNLGGEAAELNVPAEAAAGMELAGILAATADGEAAWQNGTLSLPPYSIAVLVQDL